MATAEEESLLVDVEDEPFAASPPPPPPPWGWSDEGPLRLKLDEASDDALLILFLLSFFLSFLFFRYSLDGFNDDRWLMIDD